MIDDGEECDEAVKVGRKGDGIHLFDICALWLMGRQLPFIICHDLRLRWIYLSS